LLAANLAAQPQRFNEFKDGLKDINTDDPALLLVSAIAAGWSAKWS
jgi:hypothetical protein